jgi:hypothetical protein
MRFALDTIPFSRRGSWFSIFHDIWNDATRADLYLRTHVGRGHSSCRELFRLECRRDGAPLAAVEDARPERLRLTTAGGGVVELGLDDDCQLLIRVRRDRLRLVAPAAQHALAHPLGDGRWVVEMPASHTRYLLAAGRGTLAVDAPWTVVPPGRNYHPRCDHVTIDLLPDAQGHGEFLLREIGSAVPPAVRPDFAAAARAAAADFAAFHAALPAVAPPWRAGAELAAYVAWSCLVPPRGHYRRPAMLMNKTHMDQVWSWDHCFNAIALASGHPELAWDQLLLLADHQDEHGFMPDSVSTAVLNCNYGKPPVHGWTFRHCLRQNPRFFGRPAVLRRAYDWLAAWSGWFLDHATWPGLGLPYCIHGNCSGWDNATIFDRGTPTVSPDLPAYLAVQLEVVAELATRLGRHRQARAWHDRSAAMLDGLLAHLWRGDRFVGRVCPTGETVDCQSAITLMPIILGRRLPPPVVKALVRRLRGFVTPHGLATEHPDSPDFHDAAHAYWRSSVWPPPVAIAVDGLREAGFAALSRRLARNHCRASARCGFRENHDPLTGAGRSDLAYTWSASVYLMLVAGYVMPERSSR